MGCRRVLAISTGSNSGGGTAADGTVTPAVVVVCVVGGAGEAGDGCGPDMGAEKGREEPTLVGASVWVEDRLFALPANIIIACACKCERKILRYWSNIGHVGRPEFCYGITEWDIFKTEKESPPPPSQEKCCHIR